MIVNFFNVKNEKYMPNYMDLIEVKHLIQEVEKELANKTIESELYINKDWSIVEDIVNSITDLKTKLISLRYKRSIIEFSQNEHILCQIGGK